MRSGVGQCVHHLYAVFSNIEKLFYSIVNSISFRLGQLFYVEPEKFKRLYRLYDALYLSAAFALFTTVAVFLMPIIALYTSGVTDAEYLDTRLLVLFTAVELLSSAKQPLGMLLNISGRFEETRQQALIEMGINLLVSVMSVMRFGIAGCLFGTLAAHLYRYTALILFTRTKVLGESPVGDFVRLGVNGLLCVVLLYLLGFDRCYGGGYLMVCLKGALFGLWVLPLFLVVNAVLDWRNVDTLRGLLHTLTIKKWSDGGKITMRNEEAMCEGLLSVVIPVYNIRDYVERCVRSVLAQPDVPLEVLIVDDGSTDDSGAVCDALAAEDSRVTVIHKPNGGLLGAPQLRAGAMHRASISCSWTVTTGWQRTVCRDLMPLALQDRADVVIGKVHFLREEPVMTRWEEAVEKKLHLSHSLHPVRSIF